MIMTAAVLQLTSKTLYPKRQSSLFSLFRCADMQVSEVLLTFIVDRLSSFFGIFEFLSLEFVSNFGFRASDLSRFVLRISDLTFFVLRMYLSS